jgi:hypothetical protein
MVIYPSNQGIIFIISVYDLLNSLIVNYTYQVYLMLNDNQLSPYQYCNKIFLLRMRRTLLINMDLILSRNIVILFLLMI